MIQGILHPGKSNTPFVPLCISKANGQQKFGSCSLLGCQSQQSAVSRTHQNDNILLKSYQPVLWKTVQKVLVPEDKDVSTPSSVPTSLFGPSSAWSSIPLFSAPECGSFTFSL